jgi:hypothetical protein
MNFKPAKTYEHLLTQANALARIVNAKEETENFYKERTVTDRRKTIHRLKIELESERDMNHILTSEIEALEGKIELMKLHYTLDTEENEF